MNCPACGYENREDARFCGECASPLALARSCPACGRSNPADQQFCDGCGERLTLERPLPSQRSPSAYTPKHLADKILRSKAALEGERKHVTVLFADLPDSVSLAERIGPDEMHMLLDRCFEHILDEVHRYEGTVNQFTGDGVMALFGAPLALEEAPRRALQAALGIQRELEPVSAQLRAQHGSELLMRIGIHTGLVVVGSIGDDLRMDYTAIGDTTNLANRLQGLARPGSILISEATARLVQGFFDLRTLGPTQVKGKAEPVRVLEVLGERPVSGRLEAAPGELTPFVGRESAVHSLRAAFEAARAGNGQVAFVAGEAGLGKSRLLHQFRRELGDEPHTWIQGYCAALARSTPFAPIVDALRRRFGIEARDDEATALAKIDRLRDGLGRDLDWTLPFVRQLLSLPAGEASVEEMDAAARRSETFRALQARLLRSAEQQPLVFVIEDLHWIDTASEELLAYLSDSIASSNALLLFSYRPGYRHPFGDRSYHRHVPLGALSEAEMETMTGSLLGSATLPDTLQRLIAEKAEGNPFYLEEVTRSLLEQGVLRLRGGALELAAELSDVGVPDSIQGVLMARLDRLADEPKRAMQAASVIGREFALRLLERIREVGDVQAVVERLRLLELILQAAAHPELTFMFKHALTHAVAYESIVLPRRRAYHLMVGAAIEELYRDRLAEHYESLAHHFSVGQDWERALRYHQRAAQKAAAAYANQAAAEHCRRALAIADRLGDRVPDEQRKGLELILASACGNVSEYAASGEAFLRAAKLTEVAAERAMYHAAASWAFLNAHDRQRLRETAEQARALEPPHVAPAAHALAIFSRCWAAECDGNFCEERLYDEATRLAEQSGDPVARMLTIGIGQGLRANWRGEFRRAVALSQQAVAIALEARLSFNALYPRWCLGISAASLGQYERAIAELTTGLELADRLGARAIRARLLNSLGWCLAEIGCTPRSQVLNERSVTLAREILESGDPNAAELYANGAVNLAGDRIAAGDLDAALELLEPLKAELDRPDEGFSRWRYSLHILHVLARVALARGDPERALALITQQLEGARSVRAAKIEARALEFEGRTLLTFDRRDEAEASLRGALEVATRIEYPPVIWRSRSLFAEVARRLGKREEAEAEATRARTLVERLARDLSDPDLKREFGALGERLVADPVAAYR